MQQKPLTWCAAALVAAGLLAQQPPAPQPAPQRLAPMLLPQLVVLPRADRPLLVDGVLSDWPELPAARLDDRRQLSGTAQKAWNGPNDLGAVVFFLWDADALWIACTVKDEWHRALDANTLLLTEIPAADSVILTFDPERNTRASGADPGRREDREFWLAEETGHQVVQWDRLRGTARVLEGQSARMVVTHDKEHGITSYEACIPWSEILPPGRAPEAGLVVDAQIVVNDFDETTDSMPQTRVGLTFGCSDVVDPGLFASMMLVGDAAAMQGAVPQFPPKPATATSPLPTAEHWEQWTASLLQLPPAEFRGEGAPQEAGGSKRTALLEELDEHCSRMPRVDFLELHQRIHRRMQREVAGISARGLPLLWRQRLLAVSKTGEDPVDAGALRLFRLPMGGWLCRFATGSFLIDATGAELADRLWGGAGFCVLTQPLDMTRRNDQLLVRMYMAEPPRLVFTHVAFHLPMIPMEVMPLAELGKSYGSPTGARIHALGKARPDGSVPYSCSYRIEVPGGPRLLVVGPNLTEAEVDEKSADVAIVSPRNAGLAAIVAKAAPALVLVDDAFGCQSHPTLARVTLRDLFNVQRVLRGTPSVVLAPGESWTFKVRGQ